MDYCLTMSENEKSARHAVLYKRVTSHTSAVWAATLVHKLMQNAAKDQPTHTPLLDKNLLLERFTKAKKRMLLFDYDGTLTPIVKIPSAALPSASLLDSLTKLAADPKNIVFVISGRDPDFLTRHMGHIPNLGMSAEHGCFIRDPGSTSWTNLTEDIDMGWKADVEEIFKCAI